MNETIILTFAPHSSWGYILQPLVVTIEKEGWLTIRETAGSKNVLLSRMNEASGEIVRLSEKYSDKALMKSYSKDKTVTDFLKKVKPETIEKDIRPCIERYQQEIIHRLHESGMSFYLRKTVKVRTLHKSDRIHLTEGPASAVFHFIKDSPDGLRYFVRVGEKGQEEVDLFAQTNYIVSQEPAILIIKHKLLVFEDIDAKKMTPFFTKSHIDIPASYEANYLKNFVSKCLASYTVEAEGLNIHAIEPEKRATLTLEKNSSHTPTLALDFYYNQKKMPIDHTEDKIVLVEESEGETSLSWFHSDKAWEAAQIGRLLENGLILNGLNHFSLDKNSELTTAKKRSLTDWINENKEVLQYYELS
jgi:hypothetical protein